MTAITDWVMCGLTAVYVVATILILISNKKSADAANKQLEESQQMRADAITAQKQNAALQLLNQRIDIYRTLTEWTESAKVICTNDRHYKDSLGSFYAALFRNVKYRDLIAKDNEQRSLQYEIAITPATEDKVLLDLNRRRMSLLQDIFYQRFSILCEEKRTIELVEICFSLNSQAAIKEFACAYENLFIHLNDEMDGANQMYPYANELKRCTQRLLDERVLENMKEEMQTAQLLH